MKIYNKILSGLILIMTLSDSNAQTGLLLSVETVGIFRPIDGVATAASSSDGWASSFRTGIPMNNSFRSGVSFNGQKSTSVRDGDVFSSGLLTYHNGVNRIGTSSGSALMDLYLQLDGARDLIPLTTVSFGIDATFNAWGRSTPDAFRASFAQPEPVRLGDQWVRFTITDLPDSFQLGENEKIDLGGLSLTVIPEPQLTGILLGLVPVCFIAFYRNRRLRSA